MLSIPHLIIIFVVALVVFGPEKLPELARTLGRVMAEFRRATGDIRSTFEDHLRDLEREADVRRIGGSNPPPPRETQADVPAPAEGTVPTSAPNSPERKVSGAHAPPDFESSSPSSQDAEPQGSKSDDPNHGGSGAHNASETMTDGHSA